MNNKEIKGQAQNQFMPVLFLIKRDIVGGVYRVTVAFSGIGADGSVQTQLGQYFVEKDGELISRMVGFVGTGD